VIEPPCCGEVVGEAAVGHLDHQQGVGCGGVGFEPGVGSGRHRGQVGLRFMVFHKIKGYSFQLGACRA
jgi:hypothetical protein